MKRTSFPAALALIAASTVMVVFSMHAGADDDAKDIAIAKAANLITPELSAEKALAAKAGTVVDVDLERGFKGYYYEVEIIDANAVEWEVRIDAKTGEVRSAKKDWFD